MTPIPNFIHHLPASVRREVEEGRAAVVGGALRAHFEGKAPNDVDVFVLRRECVDALLNGLVGEGFQVERKPDTDAVWQVNGAAAFPIEIIHVPMCSTPEECVAHGDFDIAAGTYSAGSFYLPEGYEFAVKNKKMRFIGLVAGESPQRSYDRYLKYNRKYGYTIDNSIQELLRLWRAGSD